MNHDITAVILAGGRGRRMGERDKGLIPVMGVPLVAHAINALRPQVGHLLVNANQNQGAYAALGYPVIGDSYRDRRGPLAGMLAGLQHAPTERVLIVPCDCPMLPRDLAQRFDAACGANRVGVAHDGQRRQPVFVLMRRHLAHELQGFMERGGRKAEDWLDRVTPTAVDFSDHPEMFLNANHPSDLGAIERWLTLSHQLA